MNQAPPSIQELPRPGPQSEAHISSGEQDRKATSVPNGIPGEISEWNMLKMRCDDYTTLRRGEATLIKQLWDRLQREAPEEREFADTLKRIQASRGGIPPSRPSWVSQRQSGPPHGHGAQQGTRGRSASPSDSSTSARERPA